MSYGSYYQGDYYRNPVPYTSSDIGEPVPGWGVNPNVAGPARVGVGAFGAGLTLSKTAIISPTTKVVQAAQAKPEEYTGSGTPGGTSDGSGGLPWYVYALVGTFVVGIAAGIAKNQKLF